MEEKKLTDDEIVKALENNAMGYGACIVGDLYQASLDLIRRLQYGYSSASKASEEWKAKYEAERKENAELQKQVNKLKEENEYLDIVAKQALTDYQNTQVQVDELTDKLGKVLLGIKADEVLIAKGIEQAVKDTAKEILIAVQKKITHLRANGHLGREQDIRLSRFLVGKAQDYGVEVE